MATEFLDNFEIISEVQSGLCFENSIVLDAFATRSSNNAAVYTVPWHPDNAACFKLAFTYAVHADMIEKWNRAQLRVARRIILRDTFDWQKSRRIYQPPSVQPQPPQFNPHSQLRYVAGVDISYPPPRYTKLKHLVCVGVTLCELPSLKLVASTETLVEMPPVPYIPSYLSFRERDPMVRAVRDFLDTKCDRIVRPQVILVDGHGRYHPRKCGSACDIGYALDMPCIGVGKDAFLFEPDCDVKKQRLVLKNQLSFLRDYLTDEIDISWMKETVGKIVRTCSESRQPVYVSVGHKISLETAVWVVKACSKHRVPEPIRYADHLTKAMMQKAEQSDQNSDVPRKHDDVRRAQSMPDLSGDVGQPSVVVERESAKSKRWLAENVSAQFADSDVDTRTIPFVGHGPRRSGAADGLSFRLRSFSASAAAVT